MPYLVVFLGAGIGGALRHGVNVWALRMFGYGFPIGTLIVNVAGSFLMGLLGVFFAYRIGLIADHAKLFLTTGVLGGFTTFSAFSLEAGLMWQRGQWYELVGYVLASVMLSIGGLFAGMAIVRVLSSS